MSVTIRVFGADATIDNYRWSSKSTALLGWLEAQLDQLGPWGSDPNPDLTMALRVVEKAGGKIVYADKTEYVDGRIY